MKKHLETRAMFAGYRPSDAQMAVKPPMHPASTFVFPDARTGAAHMETAYGVEGAETPPEGFIYSRLGNPTVTMAEQRLAAWDDSEDAALFGSGMAAISTALLGVVGRRPPGLVCGAFLRRHPPFPRRGVAVDGARGGRNGPFGPT